MLDSCFHVFKRAIRIIESRAGLTVRPTTSGPLARRRLAGGRMPGTSGTLAALMPQAGMFLWCVLPDGLDSGEVAQRALAQGVVLAPGNAFSLSQSAGSYLRFNAAQSTDPRVYEVLASAMDGAAARRPAA